MALDEIKITKAIIDSYTKKLINSLDVDVAIVGAGPAGLTCGYYLAKKKIKTAIFERKLSIGGGMWGGGIMFNEVVIQTKAKKIFDDLGIKIRAYEKDYYLADSIEAVCVLGAWAVKQGVKIFNLLSAEDVMIRKNRVTGLVLNWSAVEIANLHVDPVTIRAKFVVDATGHAAEIANILEKKLQVKLKTKTGKLMGEKPMWADVAEETIVKNSKEIYRGVYVCGMASNAVFGGPRMGPIFGGMLLSGKKVAEELIKRIK